MIMLKSIAARSSWRSPVITASLRNYIGRPSSEKIRACSDILSDALSGKSHQSLQPSFAPLSSRAIFMFRWIRLSFIQKTLALHSLFSTLSCEKTRVFLRAEVFFSFLFFIRLKFAEHFTSRFCIRDRNFRQNSICRTILVCNLSQIVNFDGFDFDSFCLVQPIRLFVPFEQGFWLAYCNMLCESTEHADDTVVRFRNKVCFENLE